MKSTSRTLSIMAVAGILISLSAIPAGASTAPTPGALAIGSELFAVDCNGNNGQLYSVDVSNADATTIGTGPNIPGAGCPWGGAWDAATGTMYYTAKDNSTGLFYLASISLTTGDTTPVGPFLLGGSPVSLPFIAIEPNGTAYALYPGTGTSILYSLDLSTGVVVQIATIAQDRLQGFAADPTTGQLYVIKYDTGAYYSLALTGVLTQIGFFPHTFVGSLQIDSNGTFWVEEDTQGADIWSFDPAQPSAAQDSGTMTVSGSPVYIDTLLLRSPDTAPTITSVAPAGSLATSTAFTYTLTATGTQPITFAVTAGVLPPGLTIDPTTGVISGIPSTPGSYTYTVTATNGAGSANLVVTQLVTLAIHLPIVSG